MLNLNTTWNEYAPEDTIYLANADRSFVLKIAEGSGDNLDSDDEDEGYVDYWYLEGYTSDGVNCTGGMLMRNTLISEDNPTIQQVIDEIKENAEIFDEPELIRNAELIDYDEGEDLYCEYEDLGAENCEKVAEELYRQKMAT